MRLWPLAILAFVVALFLCGCSTLGPHFYCDSYSNTELDLSMCYTSIKNTGDARCYARHWAKKKTRDQDAFDRCVFIETNAERKERLANEERQRENAKKERCADDVKKYGGDFWDCMRFYRDADRQEVEDARHEQAARREQDRYDDEVIADGIRSFGEALKPKPTTTCTTRPDAFGGVTTVCQ